MTPRVDQAAASSREALPRPLRRAAQHADADPPPRASAPLRCVAAGHTWPTRRQRSSAVTELSEQGDLILAQQPSISMERLASVADATIADVAAHGAPEREL